MTTLRFTIWLLPAAAAFISATALAADSTPPKPAHRISYLAPKKLAAHLDTEKEASSLEKTLKDLGCDTKRSQHQGHIDLTYECPFWRSLNLKSIEEVHQWNKWLTSKGFSVVVHAPDKSFKETVKYQLPKWRKIHGKNSTQTKAYVELLKMLSCEVKTNKHGGHEDIQYRCISWQEIGVRNHQFAHAWMGQLKKLGFATIHEH